MHPEDIEKILDKYWAVLRSIDPLQIFNLIEGLTNYDRQQIEATATQCGSARGVDKLLEAMKRRSLECFFSFIAVLEKNGYEHISEKIIQRELSSDAELDLNIARRNQTCIGNQSPRPASSARELRGQTNSKPKRGNKKVHDNDDYQSAELRQNDNLVSPSSTLSTQRTVPQDDQGSKDKEKSSTKAAEKKVNKDTDTLLDEVEESVFRRWAKLLEEIDSNEVPSWKTLKSYLPKEMTRKEVKAIERADNPGEMFLDFLSEQRNVTVGKLLEMSEMCGFRDISSQIRNYLGMPECSPIDEGGDNEEDGFESVIIGPGAEYSMTSPPQSMPDPVTSSSYSSRENERPKDIRKYPLGPTEKKPSNSLSDKSSSLEDNVLLQGKDDFVNKSQQADNRKDNLYRNKDLQNRHLQQSSKTVSETKQTVSQKGFKKSPGKVMLGKSEKLDFSSFENDLSIKAEKPDDQSGDPWETVNQLQAEKMEKIQENNANLNIAIEPDTDSNNKEDKLFGSNTGTHKTKDNGKIDKQENFAGQGQVQPESTPEQADMTRSINERSLTDLKGVHSGYRIEPRSAISSLQYAEEMANRGHPTQPASTQGMGGVGQGQNEVDQNTELSPSVNQTRTGISQNTQVNQEIDTPMVIQSAFCAPGDKVITQPSTTRCTPNDQDMTGTSPTVHQSDEQVITQPLSTKSQPDDQVIPGASPAVSQPDDQVITQPSSTRSQSDDQAITGTSPTVSRPYDQVITQPSSTRSQSDDQVITETSPTVSRPDDQVITQPSSTTSQSDDQVITETSPTVSRPDDQVITQPSSARSQSDDQVITGTSPTVSRPDDQVITQPSSTTSQSDDQVITETSPTVSRPDDQVITEPSSTRSQSDDQVITGTSPTVSRPDDQVITQPSSTRSQSDDQVITETSPTVSRPDDQVITEPSSTRSQSDDQFITETSPTVSRPDDQVITQPSSTRSQADDQFITETSPTVSQPDDQVITQPSSTRSQADDQFITETSSNMDRRDDQVITQTSSNVSPPDDRVITQTSSNVSPPDDRVITQTSSNVSPPDDRVITQTSSNVSPPDDPVVTQTSSNVRPPDDRVITQTSSNVSPPDDRVVTQTSSNVSPPDDPVLTQTSTNVRPPGDQVITQTSSNVSQPDQPAAQSVLSSEYITANSEIQSEGFNSALQGGGATAAPVAPVQVVAPDVVSQGNLEEEAKHLRAKVQNLPDTDSFRDIRNSLPSRNC